MPSNLNINTWVYDDFKKIKEICEREGLSLMKIMKEIKSERNQSRI